MARTLEFRALKTPNVHPCPDHIGLQLPKDLLPERVQTTLLKRLLINFTSCELQTCNPFSYNQVSLPTDSSYWMTMSGGPSLPHLTQHPRHPQIRLLL